MDSPDRYKEELLLSRQMLRYEMRNAIAAQDAKQKRALVARWKGAYRPEIVKELLAVAKDYEARYRIANWNLEGFDNERRKTKKF
jgi:hypothetical protein